MLALPVIVTLPPNTPEPTPGAPRPAHHTAQGYFENPWPSFSNWSMTPSVLVHMLRDWKSKPIPPPDQLPQVITPNWGHTTNASKEDLSSWKADVKATWLGHACFLVEFPPPPGSAGVRGPRVLFDPVFSKRCSPSQYIGPARVTPPPFELVELPEVDAVVLSHNHYDHTDVTTLKHIFNTQPKGSVHFFAPLGNASWFNSIGVPKDNVTELDWWGARDVEIKFPAASSGTVSSTIRITATPCQHFTGRFIHDRFHTLWASWVVEQLGTTGAPPKVWFAGDTGRMSVPRGATTEEGLPTCPAFKEIGEKFGPFDLSMIPIGAYDPRWAMSRVHCSPEDAVELHLETKSKKSIGMHWGTWVLTSEEMTEPPKRLRSACETKGLTKDDFDVCDIGETVRAKLA